MPQHGPTPQELATQSMKKFSGGGPSHRPSYAHRFSGEHPSAMASSLFNHNASQTSHAHQGIMSQGTSMGASHSVHQSQASHSNVYGSTASHSHYGTSHLHGIHSNYSYAHRHSHDHHHHLHKRQKEKTIPIIEDIPEATKVMIHETFDTHRAAKRRIHELQRENVNNDPIILLFVGSLDKRGKIWHNDCNTVDRAVTFLIKKLEVGGHFLKIYVGDRNEWMDPQNHWKIDGKYKISALPTIMVCNTFKRLNGRRSFDIEALISLLKD